MRSTTLDRGILRKVPMAPNNHMQQAKRGRLHDRAFRTYGLNVNITGPQTITGRFNTGKFIPTVIYGALRDDRSLFTVMGCNQRLALC